ERRRVGAADPVTGYLELSVRDVRVGDDDPTAQVLGLSMGGAGRQADQREASDAQGDSERSIHDLSSRGSAPPESRPGRGRRPAPGPSELRATSLSRVLIHAGVRL